jgi:Ser/Thr protein kinase RdoA (MazF antagonist)
MKSNLTQIALQFRLDGDVKSVVPLGEGFINDTYIVNTKENQHPDYLLQRKNKNIFVNIPGMMDNIQRVTNHLKKKIIEVGGNPEREALTVIETRDGKLYYQDHEGEYWAMCLLIKDHVIYEKADTIDLAKAGGKGIGKFQSLLSDFTEPLSDTLPGFHNMKFRFKQWDDVLKKDPVGRKKEMATEIAWIEERREQMLKFWDLIETGIIPKRVTHNDTKISNILFDSKNEVLCVIDLDTVLSSTALNDFGDAIRSYANTGLEDEEDLEKVGLDIDIFRAYAEGYLSETLSFLAKSELENLAFSALFITFEQTLRFLMDYIDGDNYYKIKSPDHNLVRTRAQYKLLRSMEEQYPEMVSIIDQLSGNLSN